MGFIRLPFGIRVSMEFTIGGKVVVNVYHVAMPDVVVTIDLQAVAETFANWWLVTQSGGFGDGVVLNSVSALNLDTENGEKLTYQVVPPKPGTIISPVLPNNVALVASFATAQTGRSFQGRAYMVGLTEGLVTGNDIDIGIAATYVGNFITLMTSLLAVGATLVVASFVSLGVPRLEGVATPVDSVSVNTRVDTQRRRLPI